MAASSYLLELDERRERLLAEVVDHLGVPSGSAEHEVALSFGASSLAHHDHMDAESNKVEAAICSFAEKFVMHGKTVNATRLLLLASSLIGKPMRVEGHRMDMGGVNKTAAASPPLEHPYAALALALALSGSQRWAAAREAEVEGDEREGDTPDAESVEGGGGGGGSGRLARDEEEGEEWEGAAELLAGFEGDSSRLWSSDSDEGSEREGGTEEQEEEEDGVGSLSSALPVVEDVDEGGTREWLQAFEDDGEGSPRADGYTAGEIEAERSGRWGKVENNGASTQLVEPLALSYSPSYSPNTGVDSKNLARRASHPPAARHNYGAPCIGADIRSLGGRRGALDGDVDGSSFLRPCQTLEACQTRGGKAVGRRRRSIPEAEVVRAALHMLAGLSGDIFVRRVRGDASDIGGEQLPQQERHRAVGARGTGGGGRTGGGSRGFGGRWGVVSGSARARRGQEWFSLSESAASDLAVASLSPEALAGVLEDLVRVGSTAEYLRAFVTDAEGSASVAAEAAAAVLRQRVPRGHGDGRDTAAEHDSSSSSSGSGETIVGLLSLLRPEAESLELIRQLVEDGAGWWVATLPEEEEEDAWPRNRRRRQTGAERHVGGGSGAGLHERTGRLLSVLHDALVSSALVGIGPTPPEKSRGIGDTAARAPRRRGWLLHMFCEVLAPYLRLIDSWITGGRLLDPHGELFFSRIGGGGGAEGHGRAAAAAAATADNIDRHNRQATAVSRDPVVHVWDTGIVLHSKALPPFLAPLAPAVALAGQDISLMRRVRALVGGGSSSPASLGGSSRDVGGSRRPGPPPPTSRKAGTGAMASPGSETFSLAETLSESLRRLAGRVRRANDAGPSRKKDQDDGAGCTGRGDRRSGGGGGGGGDAAAATAAVSPVSSSGLDGIVDLEESRGGKDDGRRNSASTESEEGAMSPAGTTGEEGVATETGGTEAEATAATETIRGSGSVSAAAPEGGGVTNGGSDGGDSSGVGVGGVRDRRTSSSGFGVGGGGGPATSPDVVAEEASDDVGSDDGDAAAAAAAAATATEGAKQDDDPELGFFGGTAQLALKPGAMFQRPLHPSLAPPSPPSKRGPSPAVGGRRTASCFIGGMSRHRRGGGSSGVRGAEGCAGGGGGDEDEATMEDEVAKALPPTMVLETCLLGALREHCRLASSSCLSVFADELGIVSIAGVLRDVYLSPGGAKTDAPLSRFRGVLFGLLGALPLTTAAGGGDGGGSSPAGLLVLDGLVVRDVPAFLQDGSRLTALLQSSLAMSGVEEGCGGGRRRDTSAAVGSSAGGPAVGPGKDSGGWLRSPVAGSDRPLLEHFLVECRPEVVREWRRGGAGGQRRGVGQRASSSAVNESAVADGGDGCADFPLARDGRCVDLRAFSCLQLECRLPWPISVALPPRSMDKYSRTLGLLLKLEFTNHVLEEAHVFHSHVQRDRSSSEGELDKRHLQHCRLFAFLRVARAVRSYAFTQALVKPWAAFEARLPLCDSLRSFVRLHEAYLDLILERCFLLPRTRQTLAYLLDALQAGIAFSQRYGEYVIQLDDRSGRSSDGASETNGGFTQGPTAVREEEDGGGNGGEGRGEACRESLKKLDGLWDDLVSALGFVIPLLKEMVRSRSAVYVNELLTELEFNHFFERQETWRVGRGAPRV
ncbi:unnamed protein product [Ectocarpus sp. 6 AP-2014]